MFLNEKVLVLDDASRRVLQPMMGFSDPLGLLSPFTIHGTKKLTQILGQYGNDGCMSSRLNSGADKDGKLAMDSNQGERRKSVLRTRSVKNGFANPRPCTDRKHFTSRKKMYSMIRLGAISVKRYPAGRNYCE